MREPNTQIHFEGAPVIEMAQALFFASVPGWDLLDFGLLGQKLQHRYPRHEFKIPIGETPQLQNRIVDSLQKQDLGRVPIRCWFLDKEAIELVQIQESCLIHNWRKMPLNSAYPGYENIHSNFVKDWRVFCAFLDDRSLPRPDIWKCELTYIDQFVRGGEWNSFADLPKIYRLWRGMESEGPLSSLEFASFQVNYAIPGDMPRLQFASQPAVRPHDGKEVIQLTVTATGKPSTSNETDILGWFDRAHKTVIEGFVNFTTPEVQEYWRQAK